MITPDLVNALEKGGSRRRKCIVLNGEFRAPYTSGKSWRMQLLFETFSGLRTAGS
jgi:hypothetical protein